MCSWWDFAPNQSRVADKDRLQPIAGTMLLQGARKGKVKPKSRPQTLKASLELTRSSRGRLSERTCERRARLRLRQGRESPLFVEPEYESSIRSRDVLLQVFVCNSSLQCAQTTNRQTAGLQVERPSLQVIFACINNDVEGASNANQWIAETEPLCHDSAQRLTVGQSLCEAKCAASRSE